MEPVCARNSLIVNTPLGTTNETSKILMLNIRYLQNEKAKYTRTVFDNY